MATVLDGLVSSSLKKLGQLIEDEVVMTLSVGRDIRRLKKNLEGFRAVGQDAKAQAMGDEVIKLWWKRISDVMFNVDDVIDLFTVHSHMRHRSSPCCSMFTCFAKLLDDHRVGIRIKSINIELDDIRRTSDMCNPGRPRSPQQQQITTVDTSQTAPIVEPGVVGTAITHAVDSMVQAIIVSTSDNNESCVFGIEGMGGIGKTTLAQKIFCDQRIKEEFQIHIWLCITETYTVTELLKQAIRMAGGTCGPLVAHAELLVRLKDTIARKSVFLVLDDVFVPDVWINLLRLPFEEALNACVLVTTRDHRVLQEMKTKHIHPVNRMSEADGLSLLMRNAFQQQYDGSFLELGRAIVAKCDGLPLAIKVVAGDLSARRTVGEWEMIRDSQWYIEGLPYGVGGPLYVSYRNLPHELKQCFLWCALLPPNFVIHRDVVSYWWVAEGFVRKEHDQPIHRTAERYYNELIKRNLLQPKPQFLDQGASTMHDVLRSLGQHLTKDYSLFMKVEDDLSAFMNEENNRALPNLRRLGISPAVEELPALQEHRCLRTLLVFYNQNIRSVRDDVFRKLQHIRVLILSGTSIQNIPESLGNLVLLKLLDLSHTEIKELPESTGRLISLEYICLRGCHQLRSLPASLMRLCKISFLELEDTALNHVPKGIEKFKQLYNLRGVFETEAGFRLDELRCLPNIHHLLITKLEKATPGGDHVLENCASLIKLGLCCTMGMSTSDRTLYVDDQVQAIQQVYDNLTPSPSLEYIFVIGFPGRMFPGWLGSAPELTMPRLRHMHLNECISCSELPPAGQLPQLQVLQIKGADALETIGTELLGKGVGNPAVFFPALELLHIIGMCNLKRWSVDTGNPCDSMEANFQQSLMPKLQRLLLLDCPRLRALPLVFLVNLTRIHIEGAHELKEVVDLPAVVWLKVKKNASLRKISNLGKMQDLLAQDCPTLDQGNGLWSLRRVYMVDCARAQEFRECLAEEERGIVVHVATDRRNIFPDETLYN